MTLLGGIDKTMDDKLNKRRYKSMLNIGITGILLAMFFICFIGLLSGYSANAADTASVIGKSTDNEVLFYIRGADASSPVTVQIGNKQFDNVEQHKVSEGENPVKTLILLDNSLSLSKKWGKQAKEFIDALVDAHADNEQFKVVTFADSMTRICDYSVKYKTVKKKVDAIEYKNQDSYLTGVLYDILTEIVSAKEENFNRIVIITDGADDEDIKYTQKELIDAMSDAGVVIHSIGVSGSNNSSLENMFYYSRLTGGFYSTVDSKTDIKSLCSGINKDLDMVELVVHPGKDELDGSRKAVRLTFSDGKTSKEILTEIRMPLGGVVTDAPTAEPTAEATQAPSSTPTVAPTPTEKPQQSIPVITAKSRDDKDKKEESNTTDFKKKILIAGIIAAIFVVVVSVVVIIVVVRKNKKRNEQGVIAPPPQPGPVPSGSFIVLRDIGGEGREYSAPIETSIKVGRSRGDIIVKDGTISSEHCSIEKKGRLYYVLDLNSTNGTFYDGIRTSGLTPVIDGGELRLGGHRFRLGIIDRSVTFDDSESTMMI